jgi:YHS domain-containing protein
MAIDPICGMTVDPAKAAGRHDYHGTIYYSAPSPAWNGFAPILSGR